MRAERGPQPELAEHRRVGSRSRLDDFTATFHRQPKANLQPKPPTTQG